MNIPFTAMYEIPSSSRRRRSLSANLPRRAGEDGGGAGADQLGGVEAQLAAQEAGQFGADAGDVVVELEVVQAGAGHGAELGDLRRQALLGGGRAEAQGEDVGFGRGQLEHLGAGGRDQDRRMRLLQRRAAVRRGGQLLLDDVHGVRDLLHALGRAAEAPLAVHDLLLGPRPAGAQAQVEASPGEQVEGQCAPGDLRGRVERRREHESADAQPLGDGRGGGQRREGLQGGHGVRGQQRVVAQLLGPPGQLLPGLGGGRQRRDDGEAESAGVHGSPPE